MAALINGLQLAKVIQLQDDPGGEFRILIQINNQRENVWAKLASMDAGSKRGVFFFPDVNDEVIVAFVNGDPRQPVILGSLYSNQKPPPVAPTNVNNRKAFITRSKLQVQFDDSTKTISIDTPAGNHIVLDESGKKIDIRDQNGNSLIMDPSGLTLQSPGNITIKAGINLSVNAGAVAQIESSSALNIKGAVVNIN